MKKFTVGERHVTVYDFFCPKCDTFETINCDESDWQKAIERWRTAEPTAGSG